MYNLEELPESEWLRSTILSQTRAFSSYFHVGRLMVVVLERELLRLYI
jgi:hypothetical protein